MQACLLADYENLTIEMTESGELFFTILERQEDGIVEATVKLGIDEGYNVFEGLWEWLRIHDMDFKLRN